MGKNRNHWNKANYAIFAALLFGATTPFVKILSASIQSQLLAGILYMGSGLGLGSWLILRHLSHRDKSNEPCLKKFDLPWLVAAIFAGGIVAPVMLVFGLLHTSGSTASLMLNFESVFTALLAWFVFKENFDRRIAAGMFLILAGGLCLSWNSTLISGNAIGVALMAAACFFWALDNNLTRKISDANPIQITCAKGIVSGIINIIIALWLGAKIPPLQTTAFAAFVGLLGYGVSLVLYIVSLRTLGTSRTSAYFATAPFVGALLSVMVLHDNIGARLVGAAVLMGLGIWLHLTENHQHDHSHEAMEHKHSHVHDTHHSHQHQDGEPVGEPHSHWHKHDSITHSHHHFPDSHHQHAHRFGS